MKRSRSFYGLAWPFWLLSLVALVLVAGPVFFRWDIVSGQSGPGTSGNSDADQDFIQGLRLALSGSRLNDTDRQALQKKLEYSERLTAQRARKPEAHGPKGALVPPVSMPQQPMMTTADPGERIIQGSEGMVHSWEANINNLWEGSYNGIYYQVLAGSSPDDLAQGLVIMIEYPSDQGRPFQHTYLTPSHSGTLRILERQGSRLQCAAANGSTLFFDLETQTFKP